MSFIQINPQGNCFSSCFIYPTPVIMEFFSRGPKPIHIPGTGTGGTGFELWEIGYFSTERSLAKKLKQNPFYPFFQQQPNVYVLDYYQDTLWKGTLLFLVCVLLLSLGIFTKVGSQQTWGFPAYGIGIGLWLILSSIPKRRLILNHTRGMYHFSIQGRTVCQGPMHRVYIRLAVKSDAYGRYFFQLVFCGYKLEPLVLVKLSEHYEQLEFLGRHMARKLNLNYFDCSSLSYRHVIRHWPLGSLYSPGITKRNLAGYKPRVSQYQDDDEA
ncbi:cation channel sperm-associated auxiliary subunit TMEM249-like [Monodelphis domestica]|uniref:cation channel sperm-associated auxiliary subunit TMEM249-like n=1 Tax=Monodelphis domestica TaxID=13616 RepID=UPI0024E2096A|nr:cation channel sperm-associated auxiliary subunit TMEM249-like [Monodelphis domestica]